MKTLPHVGAEMALHVLAYNLTRVLNIMGPCRLTAAILCPILGEAWTWSEELQDLRV